MSFEIYIRDRRRFVFYIEMNDLEIIQSKKKDNNQKLIQSNSTSHLKKTKGKEAHTEKDKCSRKKRTVNRMNNE